MGWGKKGGPNTTDENVNAHKDGSEVITQNAASWDEEKILEEGMRSSCTFLVGGQRESQENGADALFENILSDKFSNLKTKLSLTKIIRSPGRTHYTYICHTIEYQINILN